MRNALIHRAAPTALVAALLVGVAGCPPAPAIPRPYAPPSAAQLVAALVAQDRAVRSLRAEAKVDYRAAGSDRVKLGLDFLAVAPDHLRMEATNTFVGAVATLASDGTSFQFLDVRGSRFLAGPATACNIARLIGIALAPADVVAALRGSLPGLPTLVVPATDEGGALLAPDVKAEVGWDGHDGGREVLTLRAPSGAVTEVRLDARDRRWDLREATRRDARGSVEWSIAMDGWGEVEPPPPDEDQAAAPAASRAPVRLPSRTIIRQPAREADADLRLKAREPNIEPPPGAFRLEPPAGLPVENVDCR